tara:strand:- start:264 stop:971 length:708 start_codon:yes stop_codon:yes gene_type:complete
MKTNINRITISSYQKLNSLRQHDREKINEDIKTLTRSQFIKKHQLKFKKSNRMEFKFNDEIQLVKHNNKSEADLQNSLLIKKILRDLDYYHAANKYFWVSISFEFFDYVKNRHNDDPITHILCNESFRERTRINAISRLWMTYALSERIYPNDPETALKILWHNTQVRADLMERPNITKYMPVMRSIISGFPSDNYHRENFRNNMKEIMFLMTKRNLNILSQDELDELIHPILLK